MGAVLLTDGEKVVPGQIDFSKGIAFGDPDDPLAFHTGDGCNVSTYSMIQFSPKTSKFV